MRVSASVESLCGSFFSGIRAYAPAFRMLFSRKFAWFLLFPVVLLILLFIGGNILTTYLGDSLHHLFEDRLASWVEGISWLGWLNEAAGWIVLVVVKLVYFFLFAMYSGYVILIVMSPVYSWLSERAETHLTGRTYPFSFKQLLRDMLRGILIALRNMVVQTLISIALFLFSFIPVAGLVAPVLMLLVSAYFYGFSFLDYAVERKRIGLRDSVRYVNRRVGATTGVGIVFALALMIPLLNVLVCSFLSLVSVIAGTVVVYGDENERAVCER